MQTHEDYLATCTPEARERLLAIRAAAEQRVPGAERCISYGMPALREGRVFIYFAAFKNHIGVYPPARGPAALLEDLAPYRGPKGNLSFPLSQPLPIELIGRTIEALARQYATIA
jgi:uncharacterized protein YdhG (YjbR/CyaY superfamily)